MDEGFQAKFAIAGLIAAALMNGPKYKPETAVKTAVKVTDQLIALIEGSKKDR